MCLTEGFLKVNFITRLQRHKSVLLYLEAGLGDFYDFIDSFEFKVLPQFYFLNRNTLYCQKY